MANLKGVDPYHNDELNTSSMLESGLRQVLQMPDEELRRRAVEMGVPLTAGSLVTPGESERIRSGETPVPVLGELSSANIERFNMIRDGLIECYRMSSNNPVGQRIEGIIRALEGLEKDLGLDTPEFNPLENMSGLRSSASVDNARKVVANTVENYALHSISSIEADTNNAVPLIRIELYGTHMNTGFEIEGEVVAPHGFDGTEAIDFVYVPSGARMSVKARVAGTWEDVTERYQITVKMRRYSLKPVSRGTHWLFVGEKIAQLGKDDIPQKLNLKEDELVVGKCRIFSKDAQIIDQVRKLVRVNGVRDTNADGF